MRIAKALALGGVGARRKCETHILEGRVTVNGEVAKDLGRQVEPGKDKITFLGKPIRFEAQVYFLLYKPEGYTTTASDPHAKKTVYELLPKNLVRALAHGSGSKTRVFPVGRLDRDSTGLLLFTNDGDLANRLSHPRYEVEKAYQVELDKPFEGKDVEVLLKGIRLEDGIAKARRVEKISEKSISVVIAEGKKREVRRIFAVIGYCVIRLCRVRFGSLVLGKLSPGEGRYLSPQEVELLLKSVVHSKE